MKISILFLALLLPFQLLAQVSQVFDSLVMQSNILKEERKFALYLPPGYGSSGQSYPVVYLLHGGTGSHTDWLRKGGMKATTDKAIEEKKIAPMIIVMPDAGNSYYMNNIKGEYQFEDFFMNELIPYIEQNYRCKAAKEFRAIAGLSMGGFGSLLYSFHHPDKFAACAALSAAVRTDEEIMKLPHHEYLRRYRSSMGNLQEGDARINDFWHQNSILNLLEIMPEEQKSAVKFYIDCGDDDFLYKGNSLLHMRMRDLNIPHEYRVRNGGHTWEYWRSGLSEALIFIGKSFGSENSGGN